MWLKSSEQCSYEKKVSAVEQQKVVEMIVLVGARIMVVPAMSAPIGGIRCNHQG